MPWEAVPTQLTFNASPSGSVSLPTNSLALNVFVVGAFLGVHLAGREQHHAQLLLRCHLFAHRKLVTGRDEFEQVAVIEEIRCVPLRPTRGGRSAIR